MLKISLITLLLVALPGCTLLGLFVDKNECEENQVQCVVPDATFDGVAADTEIVKQVIEAIEKKKIKTPKTRYCEEGAISVCLMSTGRCTCKTS